MGRRTIVALLLAFCCPGPCLDPVHAADSDATGKAFADLTYHRPPKPLPEGAITSDWPRLLGPNDNGICPETKLLRSWGPGGPDLVWEMKTGEGYSTPTIAGDRLVLFHRVGDEERVECLHRETGRRFWSYSHPTSYRDRYGFGIGPRACPVLDEGRVFVLGAEGRFVCLDLMKGTVLWEDHPFQRYKVPQDFFGVVAAPLVEGDLVFLNVGAPGGPCVVAYEKATGKVVWKSGDQWGASCSAPVVAPIHGRRRLLVFAGGDSRPPTGGLLVLDPKSGAIQSRFPFRSKTYESVNASSPVVAGDRVYLSTSYKTGGVLLAIDPQGKSREVWRTEDLGCHFMTPVHRDGFLYGLHGRGRQDAAVVCLDLATGKARWSESPKLMEKMIVNGEPREVEYSIDLGSLILVEDRFLCLGEHGHLLMLDLKPTGYREIARTRLFAADETWGAPAISRGLLYVLQNKRDKVNDTGPRLLCYDLRAGS